METGLVLLGAYLLGSIPSAYWVTRWLAGADIRQLGDGNPGAKNTYEAVGKWAGVLVGAADIAKGALAVVLARYLNLSEGLVLLAGACAVLGHDYPLFLGFQGGQGMATILGVLGVLFPFDLALGLCAFAIAMLLIRNWDLSWGLGFGLFALLVWLGSAASERLGYVVFLLISILSRKLLQIRQTTHRTLQ